MQVPTRQKHSLKEDKKLLQKIEKEVLAAV